MERYDAYKIKDKVGFISFLQENKFEYNSYISSVISPGLENPIIADIIQEGRIFRGGFLIIPQDSGNESEVKKRERERLRNLVSKF